MATTSRTKDRALGKDKRGTPPSNSQTTHSQRCGSRHNNNTCPDREKSSPATATEKPMPNYLKPTISSRINEPLKLGNKKINNSHDDNQKLLRRRSFDKPPSASPRGQKALISPGPRDRGGSAPAPAIPRERKITVRSSSFGRHTVTQKAVRSPPVVSKPTKTKSTSLVNKKDNSSNYASSSSSRRPSSSRDTKLAMDHEAKQEEDVVKEVEEVVKVESETSEALSDISVPKSEMGHDDQEDVHVVESTEDEKINSCDISTCTSEDQNGIPEPHIDDHQVIEADTQQEDDKEKIGKEESHDGGLQEESVMEEETESLKELEDKGKDDDHKNIVNGSTEGDNEEVEEEVKLQHGEEALSEENKAKKPKEVEDRLEGGDEEAINKQDDDKAAANVEVVSKVQEGQGKKESPSAAYNDVIEETASKLLEKRKNKVRALVGAFETVIDYESGSSK